MTSDDILNIFRDSLFPNFVVPAGFFILCVLSGLIISAGFKRRKFSVIVLGVVAGAVCANVGAALTAVPFVIFALVPVIGLFAGFKPKLARAHR